jgi:mannose-6-phosphate isomerase-like protein (cupin superfamily)
MRCRMKANEATVMQQTQDLKVICKYYRDYRGSEQLDVAGLNKITVLIDRSQTALTEVGLNVWYAGLEGPPHFHDGKEQIFFVISGNGTVTVAGEAFHVKPNDLVYVPTGAVHRTVVEPEEPLTYLLFNAFKGAEKEGHASFAEHIAKAKHIRRQQADQAAQGAAIDWSRTMDKGRHITVELNTVQRHPDSIESVPLLDPSETHRCAVDLVVQPGGQRRTIEVRQDSEKTLFFLSGSATVCVDDERWLVAAGDVMYIPYGRTVTTETGDTGLNFLCLSTISLH